MDDELRVKIVAWLESMPWPEEYAKPRFVVPDNSVDKHKQLFGDCVDVISISDTLLPILRWLTLNREGYLQCPHCYNESSVHELERIRHCDHCGKPYSAPNPQAEPKA